MNCGEERQKSWAKRSVTTVAAAVPDERLAQGAACGPREKTVRLPRVSEIRDMFRFMDMARYSEE